MNFGFFKKAALLVGLSGGALACSHAQAVCELICECEHCNDQDEIIACDQFAGAQAVADAYECSDEYDAYLTCIEEKGDCDETEANFSTQGNGSCSGSSPLNVSCAVDSDCAPFGNGGDVRCNAGSCEQRVCAGSGQPCQNNSDCSGEDLCADDRKDYQDCIDDASDHGGVAGDF